MTDEPILKPGRNCWRIEKASRARYLIDAEEYFATLAQALTRAKHTILILGWDIDSRLRLIPDDPQAPGGAPLVDFLNKLVADNRHLHAYVLVWDFAMLYASDREWLPLFKLGWNTHRRLHFQMDDCHPIGASHHQKIVVIDDHLAFVGGLDLTKARWDTRDHQPQDPRRVTPDGQQYGPFHDVQLMVEGEVAAALGELARTRWETLTGKRPRATNQASVDLWPKDCKPHFKDLAVGIARTYPIHLKQQEVRENEKLYLDAIAAAKHTIYLENQYLSCGPIAEALRARLQEADGPEVILVSSENAKGWLAESSMDVLRARLLRALRAADAHRRFRASHPCLEGLNDALFKVHSKVMVIDDVLLRIGSANLANRSMGLDTECDLVIESRADPEVSAAISEFRNELVAEHLGSSIEAVSDAIRERGALIGAIDALNKGSRRLQDIDDAIDPALESLVPEGEPIDPERPMDPDLVVNDLLTPEDDAPTRRRWVVFALTLALLLALGGAWHWTPLSQWADPKMLLELAQPLSEMAIGPFIAIGAFVVGGLMVLPVTALIAVSVLVFGMWMGTMYAFVGTLASATVTYYLGHTLRRGVVRKVAGSRVNRISKLLAKRGVLAVAIIRLVPVAPFSVVNLVAGASHITFRDYLLGTGIGMLPGMIAMAVVIDRVQAAILEPKAGTYALLAAVVILVLLASYGFKRWLRTQDAAVMEDAKPPKHKQQQPS